MENQFESVLPKNYTFRALSNKTVYPFRQTFKCDITLQTSCSARVDVEIIDESLENPWNSIGRLNYQGTYGVISGEGDEKTINLAFAKIKSYKEKREGDPWIVTVDENFESEIQLNSKIILNFESGQITFLDDKEINSMSSWEWTFEKPIIT